jgi:hypothetical protein|tara:strand:+ start:878 stop:1099 length:222 start_codon:yes stop_codon:yes gene_type:complete
MFAIEKNIPIPERGADKKGELRLTLEKMEVGDSIVVPNFLRQVTYAAAKATKIKIAMKTINSETRDTRVWRKE